MKSFLFVVWVVGSFFSFLILWWQVDERGKDSRSLFLAPFWPAVACWLLLAYLLSGLPWGTAARRRREVAEVKHRAALMRMEHELEVERAKLDRQLDKAINR